MGENPAHYGWHNLAFLNTKRGSYKTQKSNKRGGGGEILISVPPCIRNARVKTQDTQFN